MGDKFKYDIALSFAGEDREFVEKVALELRRRKFNKRNVKVFYDANEQHNLWGDDLYQKLANVYQKQARFVIVFISHHYATKAWPKHELRNAQARALFEDSTYILPAKFDDTEIPGLSPTIGYLDLRAMTVTQFVDLVMNKLRTSNKPDLQQKFLLKTSKVIIFNNLPIGNVNVTCDEKRVVQIKTKYKNCIAFEVTYGLHAIQLYYEAPGYNDGSGITRRTYGKSEKKILQFSTNEHYFRCEFPSYSIGEIITTIFNHYPTRDILFYPIERPIKNN